VAVSVLRFKKYFPEFKNTDEFLVEQKLDMAIKETSSGAWGSNGDHAIMLLTAHYLSISPAGEQARLKMENRGDMYKVEYDRLKRASMCGLGRLS
jgi:hypothetical protein